MKEKLGKHNVHRSYKSNWSGSYDGDDVFSYRRIQRKSTSIKKIISRTEATYRKNLYEKIIKTLNVIIYSGNYRHLLKSNNTKYNNFKLIEAKKNRYYEWEFDDKLFKFSIIGKHNKIYQLYIKTLKNATTSWYISGVSYSLHDIRAEDTIKLGGKFENLTKIYSTYKVKIIFNQLRHITKFNYVEYEILENINELYS